jgi:hypothetical protein
MYQVPQVKHLLQSFTCHHVHEKHINNEHISTLVHYINRLHMIGWPITI